MKLLLGTVTADLIGMKAGAFGLKAECNMLLDMALLNCCWLDWLKIGFV